MMREQLAEHARVVGLSQLGQQDRQPIRLLDRHGRHGLHDGQKLDFQLRPDDRAGIALAHGQFVHRGSPRFGDATLARAHARQEAA